MHGHHLYGIYTELSSGIWRPWVNIQVQGWHAGWSCASHAHLFFCLQNGDAIAPHAKNRHCSWRKVSPLIRLLPSTTAVSVSAPQPTPSPQPHSRVQTTQAAQRAASESVLLLLLLFLLCFSSLKFCLHSKILLEFLFLLVRLYQGL